MNLKIYRSNQDFPKGGIMTQYLENLKPGDFVSLQGPIGRCVYLHNGKISFILILNIYFQVFFDVCF